MVEEPYSDRTVGMMITAMEGLPERETTKGERDREHERE